jgi:hypothetical protein
MKNKKLIILIAFLAVLICLIMVILLFYAVPPGFLIMLSFSVGIITGICITLIISNLIHLIKINKAEPKQTL